MSLPNYFISSLNQTLTVGGNDTQVALSTIYTQDGQLVTTADFAQFGRGILTINPTSLTGVEFASFYVVDPAIGSNGGVSGLLRGLSFKGNNQIPANQKFNPVGTPVIISFGTHNIQDLVDMINNVVINNSTLANIITTGITRLSSSSDVLIGNPTISIASPAVVTFNTHTLTAGDIVKFSTTGALPTGIVAGNSYFVITAGLTANAFEISATAGGIAIITTGSQSGTHTLTKITPTALGINDYRLNPYRADVGSTDTYAITLTGVTSYVTGQQFVFKANTSNTGPATLNVNGLGAKTIKKNVSSDLVTGDILAGQIVTVIYDGTNMQLVSQQAGVNNAALLTGSLPAIPGGSLTGVLHGLGAWSQPFTQGGYPAFAFATYHALTDGFVVLEGQSNAGTPGSLQIYSDSSATPTTIRTQSSSGQYGSSGFNMTCPIKAGDYVSITGQSYLFSGQVYWIPLI